MKKPLNNLSLKLLTASVLVALLSPESQAQFRKYRSKAKFDKVNKANANTKAIEEDDEEEAAAVSAETKEADAFGSRSKSFGFTGAQKNSKYVNLNPETAFGPEIVESFDFPDTDIMDITKHMQKLTGLNLILDKDVKGKVSIVAPTPITVGDAWKAYLTALNIRGYTLVKSGAFYKIINARDIRYTPTKIYTGSFTPNTDNYIMKVIALKNISASELSRNFRPFMTRYGRIIDIKQTNTIIVADTGTNINRLVKLVKFLDVPGHEETLQIIPVRNSSAQEIAKLLDNILKGSAGKRASRRASKTAGKSKSENISKIIAEPRTNSIIAMANAEGARQLVSLINKLDIKSIASGSNRVHVHYLNHGNSEDLSKTLSSIVSGNTAKKAKGSSRFTSGGAAADSIFSAEVKITSDKSNNALVVTASPTDWLTLKSVILKLDIPRDQVYVEGLIMETSITRNKSFGVNYLGAYGSGSAQRAGFQGSSDLTNLIGGQYTSLSGFFVGAGGGGTRSIDIGGSDVVVNNVNAIIKAVAGHAKTNVLATPQILATDNTEATFEVGESVPVVTTSTGTNGTTSSNVTQQKVAMILKLTPQINKVTRFIKLKIDQRVDDFDTGKIVGSAASAAGGVATTTRSTVTEAIIRDRDTIAMGGLMRDKETTVFSKIPLLGDIPVLGWLFKNKSRSVEKVNMLFFLTPKILAPYNEMASRNTEDVIKQRAEHLKDAVDKDSKAPFEKQMTKLSEKVSRQKEAPLYDKDASSQFIQNNNENSNYQDADDDQDE